MARESHISAYNFNKNKPTLILLHSCHRENVAKILLVIMLFRNFLNIY